MRSPICSSLLQLKQYDIEDMFRRNWETMDEIILILEVAYDAIKSINGDKYALLSDLIPMLNEVTHDLGIASDLRINTATANLFLNSFGKAIEDNLMHFNSTPLFVKSTLLDPRYKTLTLNPKSLEQILGDLSKECIMILPGEKSSETMSSIVGKVQVFHINSISKLFITLLLIDVNYLYLFAFDFLFEFDFNCDVLFNFHIYFHFENF